MSKIVRGHGQTVFAAAKFVAAALSLMPIGAASAQTQAPVVFGDWRQDHPGRSHLIAPSDLPKPYASRSASNGPSVVAPPAGARLSVPAGFSAALWASGLRMPRVIRTAPNGDVFVAERGDDRIRVLRPSSDGARPESGTVFADGLSEPFGIAFWPPADPRFVYVANTDSVVRFPYAAGDLKARGPAETVVARLPSGGHWTRDLAAAPDGSRIFLSVGSGSNMAEGMSEKPPVDAAQWDAAHGVGAAWGDEAGRAGVFTLDPANGELRGFASGLRNCVGLAIEPSSGAPWCATNERDGLGDNLPPDYATHVVIGGFYGWPWYYIGDHEDPRMKGLRPDLRGRVTVPDVLFQPHSAPLGITFYTGSMFPAEYRGDAFVALHGSWNRGLRTGYKVVRLRFADGVPTGAYEDFLTGFVVSDGAVWGRPVDLAAMRDGSLLVTEDGNNTIWRISYRK